MASPLHDLLSGIEPAPRAGRTGTPRFTKEDVEALYNHRKRGLTWKQINEALLAGGLQGYKRPESLSQTAHNSGKFHGVTPPFEKMHKSRKHVNPLAQ